PPFFSSRPPRPPSSPLFPYTTLFRSELSVPYPVTPPLGASAADGYVPTAAGLVPSQDCTALDPSFFVSAPYVGAFAPGTGAAGNWLRDAGAGTAWINFDTN